MSTKKYYYAVGRRKSTVATVKLFPNGSGKFILGFQNNPSKEKVLLEKFFGGNYHLIENALSPFKIIGANTEKKYDAEIIVSGGGITGISDSIKLGFSRALIISDSLLRTTLKPYGCLSRDSRIKERKKFGLKKARKRPTRSKR